MGSSSVVKLRQEKTRQSYILWRVFFLKKGDCERPKFLIECNLPTVVICAKVSELYMYSSLSLRIAASPVSNAVTTL